MENKLSRLKNTKAENIVNSAKVNFSFPDNAGFPFIVTPRTSGLILSQWVSDNVLMFKENLYRYGAVLFRGFAIDTVEKFQQFIGVFDAAPLEYKLRSSPRFEVARNVYHSTTYPKDQCINMHSENSYTPDAPRQIVFCCILKPDEGGETPIADNRLVVEYLSDATREKFLKYGVKYVRNITKEMGLSWEEVFQTNDRAQVEEECRRSGMSFKWIADDRLTLSWENSAIQVHPVTKEQVWFNHAFFFNKYALGEDMSTSFETDDELPFNTYFGNGDNIDRPQIEEIRTAYEKATVAFPWQKGDVLFLDNMLCSHGRNAYKGDRQIIVSMF